MDETRFSYDKLQDHHPMPRPSLIDEKTPQHCYLSKRADRVRQTRATPLENTQQPSNRVHCQWNCRHWLINIPYFQKQYSSISYPLWWLYVLTPCELTSQQCHSSTNNRPTVRHKPPLLLMIGFLSSCIPCTVSFYRWQGSLLSFLFAVNQIPQR